MLNKQYLVQKISWIGVVNDFLAKIDDHPGFWALC